jgi:spermidine synthase
MEVWTEIARARASSGEEFLLRHCNGLYEIRCNGWDLMSNRAHDSEEALARLAMSRVMGPAPRILIGGLGMGFTLRAALDHATFRRNSLNAENVIDSKNVKRASGEKPLPTFSQRALGASPADARIEVVELLPEIVAWNRGPLAPLNGRALDDRRVSVRIGDVANVLAKNVSRYDAIMLDIDNGPDAVMYGSNAALYHAEGLNVARMALAPRGVLAIWSADRSAVFEARLADAGASWDVVETPAQTRRPAPAHAIYLIDGAD